MEERLRKIAAYFEGQAWDSTWPDDIIFALAHVTYPTLAPFTLVLDNELVPEGDARFENCDLFDLRDVRDVNGNELPRPGRRPHR